MSGEQVRVETFEALSDQPFDTFSVHQLHYRPPNPVRHKIYTHRRLWTNSGTELTPLYPGYGTHFSYAYIGTPPQRQSLIVDTGSHYTAFPCVGCRQCGDHTDVYWDSSKSRTAKVSKCNNDKCTFSQSYSEGSTWNAFKVQDKFWIGGAGIGDVPAGQRYAVNLTFGCQSSVTGLFKQQLADGIMGMSIAQDTYISLLKEQKVVDTRLFSLCYRVGGGIMTIGGVDERINKHRKPLRYIRINNKLGWYSIKIKSMKLVNSNTRGDSQPIDTSSFNEGKGVIVDSGTTDTYFPSAVAREFSAAFKQITGFSYSANEVTLTPDQVLKVPDVVLTVEDIENNEFTLEIPAANYLDKVEANKYAFRIYLNEPSGTVLGANFMTGYNIGFDADNARIGFAPSECKFEDYFPTIAPTISIPSDCAAKQTTPLPQSICSADCSRDVPTNHTISDRLYRAHGFQNYGDACRPAAELQQLPCSELCKGGHTLPLTDTRCDVLPDVTLTWSNCDSDCHQSRHYLYRPSSSASSSCEVRKETRTCFSSACPVALGDYIVFVDMSTRFRPEHWSEAYSEDFYAAYHDLFDVRAQDIFTVVVSRNCLDPQDLRPTLTPSHLPHIYVLICMPLYVHICSK